MDTPTAPTGRLSLWVYRHRRLIEHSVTPNLIVGNSKLIHAQLLGGVTTGNSLAQIGFGDNTSPAATGNTSLSPDAYIKAIDGITFPATNQVAVAFSLGTFEANGLNIAEFGLFIASGLLYARLVRAAPQPKDMSVSLAASWVISF